MSAHTSRPVSRTSFAIVLFLLCMAVPAIAQPTVFIPTADDGATASSEISGACIGCSIVDVEDVIGRRVDPAQITIPLGVLSTASIRVDLPAVENRNTRAGFVVRSGGGLLDLSVLDRMTIRTYLGDDLQESLSGGSVLSLNLLANGRSKVTFRARKSYDAVEIEIAGAVAVGTQMDVLYAIITRPPALDRIIALASEGASALSQASTLCLGCTVNNIGRSIDPSILSAAEMVAPLGIAASLSLTVDYGSTLPADSWTGFWMSSVSDLLDLTVLGTITVATVDQFGGVVQSASGEDLRVTVRPDGIAFVRFRTTESFDAVRVTLQSLASVSQELNVHQAMTVPIEGTVDAQDLMAAGPVGAEARTAPETGVRLGAPRPNPSTGLARVALSSDAATQVRVSVYDALGREVAVLHDGTVQAGSRELTLDGASLAPGTYVVRAVSGSEAPQTRVLTIGR